MALPIPTSDRGTLRASVFGFPVSMHAGFLVLGGLLAFAAGIGLARTVVWVVVVALSVLVHELGHAFVMRAGGASPTITLYALGGVTQGEMPGEPSRGRRLAVSLAGPAAGVALGAVVYGIALYLPYDPGGLVEYALGAALFANVGWGVLNLLPMLPLDGGHVLLTLLPGEEQRRLRTAAVVSVVVGVLATLGALYAGLTFAALLAGYFTLGNVVTARGPRPDPAEPDLARLRECYVHGDDEGAAAAARAASLKNPHYTALASQMTAAALLARGEAADARDELLPLAPGTVDPILEAAVLLATGHDGLGRERLRAAVTEPKTTYAIRAATRVLLQRGEDPLVELDGMQQGEAWQAAQEGAHHAGEYETAAKLGERALQAGHAQPALVGYNTACSWALAGDDRRALAALRAALDAGWTDLDQFDRDPDLASVRELPEFAALRAGR